MRSPRVSHYRLFFIILSSYLFFNFGLDQRILVRAFAADNSWVLLVEWLVHLYFQAFDICVAAFLDLSLDELFRVRSLV